MDNIENYDVDGTFHAEFGEQFSQLDPKVESQKQHDFATKNIEDILLPKIKKQVPVPANQQ